MSKVANSNDAFFDSPYFRLNKKLLSVAGRWPYQDKKKQIIIVSSIFLAILSVVIPEVIYLIDVIKDSNKVLDCLPALFITYGAYVVLINSAINHKLMRKIIDDIVKNWSNIRDEEELRVFREYARQGQILTEFYSAMVLLCVFTFSAVPLLPKLFDVIAPLNESRPLNNLLEVKYFVDEHKYYVPIFLHGLQAALAVVFLVITMDSYFVVIVQHACGLFAVLGMKLSNISRENAKIRHKFSRDEQDKIICNKIIECMNLHCDCLRFAELIEQSFHVSWFMQLFLNMIVLSVTAVQTITRSNEVLLLLKYGLNTSGIVFRVSYVSWPGQKILDHSTQLNEFIYNLTWYEFPPKAKKLLLFMLMRSSKPCYISIGKMAILNFETYCTLMQTAMSYFTMILSTQ